ncbi:MAG: hypothetical protein IPP32_12795 [Bacteroidetes bacterium]|nr:hypothetical protein [Bacteroidota bacterium]
MEDRLQKMNEDELTEMFLYGITKEIFPNDENDAFRRYILEDENFVDWLLKLFVRQGLYTFSNNKYEFTNKYSVVKRIGGWANYRNRQLRDEERTATLEQTGIDANINTVKTNKIQVGFSLLMMFFVLVNLLYVAFGYDVAKKSQEDHVQDEILKSGLQRLDSTQKMILNSIQNYVSFQKQQSQQDSLMKTKTLKTVSKKP